MTIILVSYSLHQCAPACSMGMQKIIVQEIMDFYKALLNLQMAKYSSVKVSHFDLFLEIQNQSKP